MKTVIDILPYLGGIYELLARIIPTNKNWSIIHSVLGLLTNLSSSLNVEKSKPTKNFPSAMLVLIIASFLFSCASIKTECVHQSYKQVVAILPDGSYQYISVPFCDTVRFTKKVPKSIQ